MIGILGGTFDPIHNGHLHIASQVLTRLEMEQLQFMPCALPVHRDRPHASVTDRLAMIELSIADQSAFTVNTLELDRDGPSYSVDSLREIHRQTDSVLVLVLGADAFNGFASWKLPCEILQLAHLVVCHRPGFKLTQDNFNEFHVGSALELNDRGSGGILMLEVDAIDCSSSQVRAALDRGKMPRHCLHPAVANYINQHHLYRKPGD
ncbi:MAG: nicotinate-nucleotide adenylyltransferase [Gammaproteobacteria bacterium]|nr:nicotinate-nucleotide adenylyltransferase [Gammaproteobacteria bacterium]